MVRILRESNNELKEIPLECIKGATLLSREEAENLLTRKERMCKGTQQAKDNDLYVYSNGYSNYWLRSAGSNYIYVCGVIGDGYVGYNCGVGSTYIGVRPALIISNLQSSNLKIGDSFEFGGYTFKIISNSLALCDVIVDACPFNENFKDGNDYETSYIKSRVDDWFNKVYAYEKRLSGQKYRPKSDEAIADENDFGF